MFVSIKRKIIIYKKINIILIKNTTKLLNFNYKNNIKYLKQIAHLNKM